jgi:hypothetical protein
MAGKRGLHVGADLTVILAATGLIVRANEAMLGLMMYV